MLSIAYMLGSSSSCYASCLCQPSFKLWEVSATSSIRQGVPALQGAAVLLLFPLLLLGDPAAARHRADEKPAGLDAAETAAAGAAEETGALTAPLLDPVHENGRL